MELITPSTKLRKGHYYRLNSDAIEKLTNAEVGNMKVAVISVFGKGSRVIFDLLLRYANHSFKQGRSANDDWLVEGIQPGKDSDFQAASSMMISPELFITKSKNDEEIAILLTGSHQGRLSFEEEAGTFAIHALMSSCQLFHVNKRISEEQLKHIETFTEFAKRLQDVGDQLLDVWKRNKAFQRLLFVVRGWDNPTQYDCGFDGGQRYLIESVIHDARLAPDRLKTRQNVISSFDEMKCFLMADSRLGIRSAKPSFSDESSSLFMAHSRILVQTILAPDNLILKRIGGEVVTVERLVQCIRNWVAKLNSEALPDVNSLYRPALQAQYTILIKQSMQLYTTRMIELGSEGPHYVNKTELNTWHEEAKVIAMNYFEEKREYDASLSVKHKINLNRAIDEKFAEIRAENNMKYRPFASLLWMPLLSSALITYCVWTFNNHTNNKPMSALVNLTAFMAFWIGATIFFRWGYLIYRVALSVTTNNVIQIVVWSGALIYGGFRLFMYVYPKKLKLWSL